jgi:hypothetical protein
VDINLKRIITIKNDDLFLPMDSELIQNSSTNTIAEKLAIANIPNDSINYAKITRIDMIPFVENGIPNFVFDIRTYFNEGIPDELNLYMTIWFREDNEGVSETYSYKYGTLLKDTEFILDLTDIKDKILKIDFRLGTKYYNIKDYYYKTWDIRRLTTSLFLYDYKIQEIPIPLHQQTSQSSLAAHLKGKEVKLQENINVYKIKGINRIPLKELAEKIFIYDIPYIPGLIPEGTDSTLVPDFQDGITSFLSSTSSKYRGDEQIFIRVPQDELASSYKYFCYIDNTFWEIASDKNNWSSVLKLFQSMTLIDLGEFSRTIFTKENDIYSIDIDTMHLVYIKYQPLTISDLRIRYTIDKLVSVKPLHAGEVEYSPPVLHLGGTNYYQDAIFAIVSGNTGSVYYKATQIN